nr:transposase [Streptomyces albofaciens]
MDAGYRTTAIDHGARLGIDVQPVARPPGSSGFAVIPRRWTIERSIGWLMHHRRLVRDHESLPAPQRSPDPARDDRLHDPPPHR